LTLQCSFVKLQDEPMLYYQLLLRHVVLVLFYHSWSE